MDKPIVCKNDLHYQDHISEIVEKYGFCEDHLSNKENDCQGSD